MCDWIVRALAASMKALQRVAFATALAVFAAPAAAAPCAGFSDVDDASPFCTNVGWLKNRAITLGCTSTTLFCPNDAVSRLQMAAFMNRLGTAMTPVQLRVDDAPGAIDLDASPVVCQTGDFVAEGFARIAFADVRLSASATADVGLAADLVMSLDGGASWASLNVFANRGFVAANQWGTLSDLGYSNLDAAQSARWGVRMSRGGLPGGTDLADSRCQLRVRIHPAPVNRAPVVDAGPDQTITLPALANLAGTASDDGLPAPPGAIALTWSVQSGPGTVSFGNASAAVTTASFSAAGVYVLRLTASDGALATPSEVTITVNAAVVIPPNPSSVAPPVDPTVPTSVFASTAFLYNGATPIQTGVAPGTIQAQRAAVLRGKVQARDGSALSGVAITIAGHAEFGQTISRADGAFDLAVNGGGSLLVDYRKAGFLPVQRQVNVPWQDFAMLPDVVMIPLDAQVTTISLNSAALQVARGSAVNDADGSRRATLLVAQGTSASLVLPNGSAQPMASLNVRATEYTVGANGPNAMPAVLPPASGYTYAVELSADEAIAAGATSVVFSQPIASYTENFLGFPVGGAVPAGYYDRTKGAWVPSANGRVIRITAINAGLATVDSVGTGTLPALLLDNAERQQLALLYGVGQELWRVPVTHFTPWDYNWPYGPPDDAISPEDASVAGDDTVDDPMCSAGSIIECENQTLGETVGVVGTPYTLNYRSSRAPGWVAGRTLRLVLSGSTVPASLKRIELDVQVAGRSFPQTFGAASNQQTLFTWDGTDVYGRVLQGSQPAIVKISYVYDATYQTPDALGAAFGRFGGTALSANRSRSEIFVSRSLETPLGSMDGRAFGLSGWSLDAHHFYDFNAQVLHLGNGARSSAKAIGRMIATIAGSGPGSAAGAFGGDGGPATQASLNRPRGVAVAPDGAVYIVDNQNERIRRVGSDGIIGTVAGNGAFGSGGDGGPATQASLRSPEGIALGPDGSFYIADTNNMRIRRVGPDGIISTVAGNGTFGFSGDGGLATQASLAIPRGVAVSPDGSLYIADTNNSRIRRVGSDGIITTVAGSATAGFSGDGGLATLAQLESPFGVAVAPDGALIIADSGNRRVRQVTPDGIISTIAGTGVAGFSGDRGPATAAQLNLVAAVAVTPDGGFYIVDQDFLRSRLRHVGPDGIITTVTGEESGFSGDGGLAIQAASNGISGVAVAPDGSVHMSDSGNNRIRRIGPALRGFAATEIAIASDDGSTVHGFDAIGRHTRTLAALTGAALLEFGYDATGRLIRITEKTGGIDNVTSILRDASGKATAIDAPFGQRTLLAVDANEFLSSITNPAGEQIQLASTAGGLLTALTDPRGRTSLYQYDAGGRLTRNTDPVGGFQALARAELPAGFTAARSTALGRTTSHRVETLSGDVRNRTVTSPDGTVALSEEHFDAGTRTSTAPDGTVTIQVRGPDPRFGMQAPIVKSLSVAIPGGPTLAAASTQDAVLGDPADPFSMTSLTGTSTIDGRTTTSIYTAATRTANITTPAGRTASLTSDALGRPVQTQSGGLAPTIYSYDARGRLASVTRGVGANSRTYVFEYSAAGFLAKITDPIGRVAQFSHDAAGRVVSKTLPDTRVVGFGYDASGNVTSLTPPGRPAHTFGYSDRDELTLATPPFVAGTGASSFSYNVDRQYVTTARPDNRSVTIGYDSAGRPNARAFAAGGVTTGSDTTSYDSAGRVASVAAASGLTTSYAYAGSLLTAESWSGSTAGSVTRAYDTSFRLASQSVNGANTVVFSYDNDSLMIGAGDLAIARDLQHGLATGSTLGVVGTSTGYNEFGETTSYAASANAASLYSMNYVRDGLGRISQKTETVGGVTDTYVYTYDAVGQVTQVTRNGAVVESYGYDANGNRLTANVAGSSVTASYDAQDRLTSYGATSFAYNAAGELASRTAGGQTTNYQYDAIGNLLGVALPSGTAITYVVDGRNRRVGKRVNGTLVQGLLYGDSLRPVAELDGAGALVSRFVYAGRHVPAYVIKGGAAHRILTDQVGSVRLVVNSGTGAIVQRIDYDTFGNVVADTNPGFQPFGFAGGIFDAATGLVRFGARDYDSQIGRWTAKDRIGFSGGDANLYRYVRNNPVNLIDPIGMAGEEQTLLEQLLEGLAKTEGAILRGEDVARNEGLADKLREVIRQHTKGGVHKDSANDIAGIPRKKPSLFCGGLASAASGAFGLLDFVVVAQRSQDSGRSFFEELNVQATDIKEAQAAAGIHTTVNFFGPFLYVEGGNSAGPSFNDFGSL